MWQSDYRAHFVDFLGKLVSRSSYHATQLNVNCISRTAPATVKRIWDILKMLPYMKILYNDSDPSPLKEPARQRCLI
jgi:hypothetical protein